MDRRGLSLSMLLVWNKHEWTDYLCPHCKCVPRNAVRTGCGHRLCLQCAQVVFSQPGPRCPRSDCEELLLKPGRPPFVPDETLRKRIDGLSTLCANNTKGCAWMGIVKDLDYHLRTCGYANVQCKHCAEWIIRREEKDHLDSCRWVEVTCPFVDIGCSHTDKMPKVKLVDEHLAGDGLIYHMEIVSRLLKKLSSEKERVQRLKSQLEEREDIIDSLETQIMALEHKHIQLKEVYERVEEQHKRNLSQKGPLQRRMTIIEDRNFDGYMIWRVTKFSSATEDARTGKSMCILSSPFYTSRYGYKLRLILYPLGDGAGKSTHMSVFLALMKGEFDNLLYWPFSHQVTIRLLNQTHGRDVTETFVPDSRSACFRKPTADMSAGAGCPRFVTLRQLTTRGFVDEDTLFIEAKVDPFNMKRP